MLENSRQEAAPLDIRMQSQNVVNLVNFVSVRKNRIHLRVGVFSAFSENLISSVCNLRERLNASSTISLGYF